MSDMNGTRRMAQTPAEDARVAAEIQAATTELNRAIWAAHQAGLRVEVDHRATHVLPDRFPCPTVLTTVSRAL